MRRVLFIFSTLNDNDVQWLTRVGERKRFAQKEVLIQQGQPIADVFILLDGQLSVRIKADGGEQEIAVLAPGEVVGELSFLDTHPPNATVVASTPVITLAIARSVLNAKLTADTGFAARFYRALGIFLATRLRQTVDRMGFGSADSLAEDEQTADEIDPDLLDSLALAGKRFEMILEHFRDG